jgi:hypothetical protein
MFDWFDESKRSVDLDLPRTKSAEVRDEGEA